jgi:hypothetical protein
MRAVHVEIIALVDVGRPAQRERVVGGVGDRHVQAIPRNTGGAPTGNVAGEPNVGITRTGPRSQIDNLPMRVVERRISPPRVIANVKPPGSVERDDGVTDDDRLEHNLIQFWNRLYYAPSGPDAIFPSS